ncbi:MAG: potassium channel protein [Planctomycetaceae bacterium]|nr:potassium channel protein [Planctomycetaceae bacterium]
MKVEATRPARGLLRAALRRLRWFRPTHKAARLIRRPAVVPEVPAKASFWGRSSVRRIVLGFAALGFVMVYGVTGYMIMGWTFMDAFYQVFITISAVGLTEVHPLSTTPLRLHTMFVITLGLFSVAFTLGGFISLLTEGEFQKYLGQQRMMRQIETLQGHTIVVGFGRVGALVCEGLASSEIPFVVIQLDHDRVLEMESRGYLHFIGDATDEAVLKEAGIERASVLVTAMPNDAVNVFITLTARELAPKLMIIARAEQPSTGKKLRQAGANHVITPAAIGARRIVSLLTNPTAVEFVELVTQRSSLAIEMDDVPIKSNSPLAGKTLRDADIGRRTGVIVIAIKRSDGHVEFPPSGDQPFGPGDSIVLIGRRANLDQFREKFVVS